MTHPIEDRRHRRKIDRDLVGQAVDRHKRRFVAGNVRMIPARQLTMGALDFVRARIWRYAEYIVVVAHDSTLAVLQKRCRTPPHQVNIDKAPRVPEA